uniref:Uncharacterized protein n=1 Tax=Lepeophtheirus salmonis TaxID=72036 RepID=A0A0K2VCI4_LEPSM
MRIPLFIIQSVGNPLQNNCKYDLKSRSLFSHTKRLTHSSFFSTYTGYPFSFYV